MAWHWLSLVTCYHWWLPSTWLKSKDKTMTCVKRVFMKRHTKARWLAILREIAAAVVIHASVFPPWLCIFCVVADVWGSWAGLLLLEMWRSDTELAAGAKEQLGESGILPAAVDGPCTPLSYHWVHLLCECTCVHVKFNAWIFDFLCTWLGTGLVQFAYSESCHLPVTSFCHWERDDSS